MSTANKRKKSSRSSRRRFVTPGDQSQRLLTHAVQHTSGNKKAEQDAENETEEKLKETKDVGKKSGNKVVEDLLKAVSDVRPVVPQRVEQPTA